MAVVEGVEEAATLRVAIQELPVEAAGIVELLIALVLCRKGTRESRQQAEGQPDMPPVHGHSLLLHSPARRGISHGRAKLCESPTVMAISGPTACRSRLRTPRSNTVVVVH